MEDTLENCICVKDFKKLAAKRLTATASVYYNSGATDEQTFEENCTAFKKWRFQPRVLQDVSKVDTTTTVLGDEIPFPICVAPTAAHKMASPGGEFDSAKAAASLKTGFALSNWATTSMKEVNSNVPSVLRWFQLYIFKDRELTKSLVERAEKNGFRGIMVTVDSPVIGQNYKQDRHQLTPPPDLVLKNFDETDDRFNKELMAHSGADYSKYVTSLIDPSLTWNWKVLEILRDELTMKLLGTRSIVELQMLPDLVVHESAISTRL